MMSALAQAIDIAQRAGVSAKASDMLPEVDELSATVRRLICSFCSDAAHPADPRESAALREAVWVLGELAKISVELVAIRDAAAGEGGS